MAANVRVCRAFQFTPLQRLEERYWYVPSLNTIDLYWALQLCPSPLIFLCVCVCMFAHTHCVYSSCRPPSRHESRHKGFYQNDHTSTSFQMTLDTRASNVCIVLHQEDERCLGAAQCRPNMDIGSFEYSRVLFVFLHNDSCA